MQLRFFISLILLGALLVISEILISGNNSNYSGDIILNSVESKKGADRNKYNLSIEYLDSSKVIGIDENIYFNNSGLLKTDSLYLNIPTKYLNDYTQIQSYRFEIEFIKVNDIDIKYRFINRMEKGFVNNSLIKFINPAADKGKLHIAIKYKIIFPEGKDIYSEEFYSFENWMITLPHIENGFFATFPTHKYLETFLDFSDFEVTIKLPDKYKIVTSGKVIKNIQYKNSLTYIAKNVRCFNWFAFSNLMKKEEYVIVGNQKIKVSVFINENKDGYLTRYFESAEKYLKSMAELNKYPYKELKVIDLPSTNMDNKSYPGIIAMNSDLISPQKILKLESDFASLFAEQYFGNAINSCRITEEWMSKGISRFIGEKLLRNNFGIPISYFKIADYYPVYGLLFMDYFGIPLIYTIGETEIPRGAADIAEYYNNLNFGNVSTPSYKFPEKKLLKIASVIKPNISLLAFENYVGEGVFNERIKKYVSRNWMKLTSSSDFKSSMTESLAAEHEKIYNELFSSDKKFDYAVKGIEKRGKNIYDIIVVRNEAGVLPVTINIETEDSSITKYWSGVEKYHVFSVNSTSPVLSATIDFNNKNVLDLFYSNNSYTVDKNYWGSFSYATRVFFWFQNALMIIGGAV